METSFWALQQIGVVILHHSALIKLLWMQTLDSIPQLSENTVKIYSGLQFTAGESIAILFRD